MGDPTLYEPGWMSTSKQTLTQYRLLLSPLPSLKIALGQRAPLDPTYFKVGENKSWTESLLSSLDSFEALGDFRIAPKPSSAEKYKCGVRYKSHFPLLSCGVLDQIIILGTTKDKLEGYGRIT